MPLEISSRSESVNASLERCRTAGRIPPGLISYGPDFFAMARLGAHYVDRILKGAKPVELPIEQPTKYLLIINLKTSKRRFGPNPDIGDLRSSPPSRRRKTGSPPAMP